MSITFRRQGAAVRDQAPDPAPPEAASMKLAWLAGMGTLAGLGLAAGLYLAWQEPVDRPLPAGPQIVSEPLRPEPATIGGVGRAMASLERDLSVWHRLVAPQGPLDLGALRAGLQPGAAEATIAPPQAEAAPAPDPDRVALVLLAVLLAAVTLVVGFAALLLERMLLGPFRALRAAAAALGDGALDTPIPGTGRDDEAGALARTLERLRRIALAAERDADPATLAEAGLRLDDAARRIEGAAAAAAALALEASLDSAQADQPGIAQGVWELSHQVVAIRAAAERAAEAILRLEQAFVGQAGERETLRIFAASDAD